MYLTLVQLGITDVASFGRGKLYMVKVFACHAAKLLFLALVSHTWLYMMRHEAWINFGRKKSRNVNTFDAAYGQILQDNVARDICNDE